MAHSCFAVMLTFLNTNCLETANSIIDDLMLF